MGECMVTKNIETDIKVKCVEEQITRKGQHAGIICE